MTGKGHISSFQATVGNVRVARKLPFACAKLHHATQHWEITGWYMIPNKDFGGVSPREYLKGKDWAERVRVGRDALIKVGVLKP